MMGCIKLSSTKSIRPGKVKINSSLLERVGLIHLDGMNSAQINVIFHLHGMIWTHFGELY